MSAPFEPGDVVVCVDDFSHIPTEARWNPRLGCYYRIADVFPGDGYCVVDLCEGPDVNDDAGWDACMFRKIDDEQIPEVLERLKALGKQRERVS